MNIQRTVTETFTMKLADRCPRVRDLHTLLSRMPNGYLVTDVDLNMIGYLAITCTTEPEEVAHDEP